MAVAQRWPPGARRPAQTEPDEDVGDYQTRDDLHDQLEEALAHEAALAPPAGSREIDTASPALHTGPLRRSTCAIRDRDPDATTVFLQADEVPAARGCRN